MQYADISLKHRIPKLFEGLRDVEINFAVDVILGSLWREGQYIKPDNGR